MPILGAPLFLIGAIRIARIEARFSTSDAEKSDAKLK
jgi:hypothetical protein